MRAIATFATVMALVASAQETTTGTGSVLEGGDVTAVYRGTGEIQKGEPPRISSITQIDTIATPLDSLCLALSPISDFGVYSEVVDVLSSEQVTRPYLPFFTEPPVVEFMPVRGGDVSRWQLIITDYLGESVFTYDGKGKPPDALSWDGRDAKGDMVRVGFPYSYIFTTWDRSENKRNYIGTPFTVNALHWGVENDTYLRVVGNRVFVMNRGDLSDEGKRLLLRAAEYVRHHPESSIEVSIFADAADLANNRAENVRAFLAYTLIVPKDDIRVATQVQPESVYKEDGYCQIRVLATRRQ